MTRNALYTYLFKIYPIIWRQNELVESNVLVKWVIIWR
jgi:hypothetical protein